jgi:membrane-associated protease RseP (regulator of RpoE activity)
MKKVVSVVLFFTIVSVVSLAEPQPRVFIHGSHGYVYVSGVDHALPREDGAGHDQTMELAKTFLQRCPNVTPTVNRDNADFDVQLNWTPRTRLFFGGKIIHKPDQILVTNRNGDILYSGVARTVGGDVEGACRAIQRLEPSTVAQWRQATVAANDSYQELPNGLSSIYAPVKHASETYVPETSKATFVPVAANNSGASKTASLSPSATFVVPALGVAVTTRTEGGGAQIVGITSGGVAELAFLHVKDVITSVDGKPVSTPVELAAMLQDRPSGSQVRLGYLFRTSALGYMSQEKLLVLK